MFGRNSSKCIFSLKKKLQEAHKLLDEIEKKAKESFPAMKIVKAVGKGDCRDEIIEYVGSMNAECLIVGSKDRNALKR